MNYKLGLVQINVTDRKRAEEFYVNTLDFKKIIRDPLTGVESGGDSDSGPIFLDNGCGGTILLYPLNITKYIPFDIQTKPVLCWSFMWMTSTKHTGIGEQKASSLLRSTGLKKNRG